MRATPPSKPNPLPSRKVTHFAADGHLVELYRDGAGVSKLAHIHPDGRPVSCGGTRIGGILIEVLLDDMLTGGDVVIPPHPHIERQETSVLFRDIRAFFEEHVTWSRPFLIGAVAYTIASWVYERFQFFPYLQFIGPPGSGKTRSLDVLGAVCYHSTELASATPATLFGFYPDTTDG